MPTTARALVLCPLCRAFINLTGTGETPGDPVIFPAHPTSLNGPECLATDITADVLMAAARAAGADTFAQVSDNPDLIADIRRRISEN